MNIINLFFILMVIVSSLYTLLRENSLYEKSLCEHNFLLQADKDKFHYLAQYDTLTKLPNRSYFQTYIESLIASVDLKTHFITLFFMDIDGLKKINDRYGHDAGDSLLLEAGKRLQSCFRENDFLSRLGGDEFTAVISHLKNDRVPQTISLRILEEFNKPFDISFEPINTSISIGLATYPLTTLNVDELIILADQAMYKAKKAGGNQFEESG
ncbi:MAG: GGDEF domain-containing protein [Tatlockia sp.]|nr:GGDEF domain-containing protein [Tatlockia sp.]